MSWSVRGGSLRVPSTSMRVEPVPLFSDNYAYLLFDEAHPEVVAAVDPADADTFLSFASCKFGGARPTHVLTTHKHWDHAGGNRDMARAVPGLVVYGSAYEDIPACTQAVREGDEFAIGASNLRARVLFTPCHTRGHILYYVRDSAAPDDAPGVLFSGDTLFVGGCGRFFEGDGAQMYEAMGKIAALPRNTYVFCGHEYTAKNLAFAQSVDADNEALQRKVEAVKRQRAAGEATVPSTVGDELAYNVFMRCRDAREMAEMRRRKDAF